MTEKPDIFKLNNESVFKECPKCNREGMALQEVAQGIEVLIMDESVMRESLIFPEICTVCLAQLKLKVEQTNKLKSGDNLQSKLARYLAGNKYFKTIEAPEEFAASLIDTFSKYSDFENELKKMTFWLDINQARRKKNYKRFIFNWFARIKQRAVNYNKMKVFENNLKNSSGA